MESNGKLDVAAAIDECVIASSTTDRSLGTVHTRTYASLNTVATLSISSTLITTKIHDALRVNHIQPSSLPNAKNPTIKHGLNGKPSVPRYDAEEGQAKRLKQGKSWKLAAELRNSIA